MNGCVAKTKDRRELFPLRPVWSSSHLRRRSVRALNTPRVLFENRENHNRLQKSPVAFVELWVSTHGLELPVLSNRKKLKESDHKNSFGTSFVVIFYLYYAK